MDVKLGICNFCVPGTGIFAPKFVSESGLDGMSVEFGTYENRFPTATRQVMDEYLAAAETYKIEYPNVGCSCFDFIPLQAHRGSAMYDVVHNALKLAIDTAAYMKIPMVFIPTFCVSELVTDDDITNAVNTLQFASKYAADKGVLISWENMLPAEKQIEVYERVNCENFSLFYDSYNYFFQKGYDQVEILDKVYPYLGPQLHVKDGKPGVLAGSLLGEGDSGFFNVIDYLKKKDYKGWIIMENLYEKQPTNTFETDIFDLFSRDVATLQNATRD